MAVLSGRTLIAVDTNVLYDLALNDNDVIDAISTIRSRIQDPQFIISPTVAQEIAHEVESDGEASATAKIVVEKAVFSWGFFPAQLGDATLEFAAEQIGRSLRIENLLPFEEINDGLVAGESAVLRAQLLLSSDHHLLDIDFEQAATITSRYGFSLPLIAKPRMIAERFS